MIKQKKGQFQNLSVLAVGVLTFSLVMIISLLIVAQGKEQTLDFAATLSFTNSTRTITVDAFTPLDVSCVNERALAVLQVYNGTAGNATPDGDGLNDMMLLNSGNYTIVGNSINVSDDALGVAVDQLGTSVNITYTCTSNSRAYNATTTLQNATNELPGWAPIIIIVSVGAILFGMIAGFLFLRGRR